MESRFLPVITWIPGPSQVAIFRQNAIMDENVFPLRTAPSQMLARPVAFAIALACAVDHFKAGGVVVTGLPTC